MEFQETSSKQIVPWDDLELAKLYHILQNAGYEPERLARVRPSQIVYSMAWNLGAQKPGQVTQERSLNIANNDASLVTGIQFSIIRPEILLAGETDPDNYVRLDDPTKLHAGVDPLDYVSMQVRQTASEQLSTGYVPCSHWDKNAKGWMPSALDFVPGGNFSSYELAFRTEKGFTFEALRVSLTAIQLVGL